MTTFTVTTASDNDADGLTLREALAQADLDAAADFIDFDGDFLVSGNVDDGTAADFAFVVHTDLASPRAPDFFALSRPASLLSLPSLARVRLHCSQKWKPKQQNTASL